MHRIALTFAFFSSLCTAQTPPVHVLIGGGLLGKTDGFCEISKSPGPADNPCPDGRIPLGGLSGFQKEVNRARGAGAYLLLTGNNLPKDFNANHYENDPFIRQFQSLGADVTALGQDDLLRAVFPARLREAETPPSHFTRSVRDFLRKSDFHFLASNAAIRTNQTGLNRIFFKGYELMIPADQSIPWTTTSLTFAVPDTRARGLQVVIDGGGQTATRSVDVKDGSGKLPVTLKPGPYSLTVLDSPLEVRFEFHVDAALTPWDSKRPDLDGLPVAWVSHPDSTPLMVVSLIDPAVLDILDPNLWKEHSANGGDSLVLYPPAETSKFLLARAAGAGKADAIPVLISDLNDSLAAQVASSSAAWRLVSFGADSHLLGCESGDSGCAKGRDPGYNSGAFSTLNGSRVWVRPEWTGETLIDISAKSRAGGRWDDISVSRRDVPGERLPPARNLLSFARPANPAKRIWWNSRDDMAVVLMDAMRGHLKTDLAVADERAIDPEVLSELNAMACGGKISTIGPRELLEILWRHDPYTVIKINGKDLVAALGKLAKLAADEDSGGICVRGLGGPQFHQACSLPDPVKPNLLEINARYLNQDEYYSVALPQSLARAAALAYPKNHMVNVFDTVLRYVRTLTPEMLDRISPDDGGSTTCKPQQPTVAAPTQITGIGAPAAPLPAAASAFLPAPAAPPAQSSPPQPLKWPNLLGRKARSLIFLPPASIEWGGQNYSVPNHGNKPDTSGFAAIPLVGEKAQRTLKFNMAGELHVVPLDLQAISLDIFSKVNLNRLETDPNSPTGFKQFSYTPDQWTNGAVLRSKIVTDLVTRASAAIGRHFLPGSKRPSLRLQPFVGYFDDTSVYHYTATYTRKSDNAAFQETDAKPNYAYFGMGLELSPIAIGKHFSVNNTRLEQDFGINYAAPKGVFIAGQSYDMDAIRRCGVQNLLDGGVSTCIQAPAAGPQEVRFQYATQRQSRRQLLTSLVLAFGPESRKETFSLDIKANQWGAASGGYTPLDPIRTAEFIFKSSFPVGAGIAFGPYFRYLTVNAFGSDGNFISRRYGFTLTIPLTAKTGQSRFFF